MIRRILIGAMFLVACAPAPKPAEVTTLSDNRTPERRIADSTRILVRIGVDQADTGSLRAQLAASERTRERAIGFVTDARRSAATATESFLQAIEKGDRLQKLVASSGDNDRPSRYARYWSSTRTKLESARSRSDLAKQAADSALGCSAMPCSSAMANVLRNHMLAAALDGMEVDAVKVVTCFLGRDRELGLVDQTFERRGFDPEDVRERAGREFREVGLRQALQAKA
jgi:hypothetical protein